MISEQIAFAAMFYFEHVFVSCMLINKNVLEWFLLTICEEHPLHRSTNLFSRNHPILSFWLIRVAWQMPDTEQFATLSNWQKHRRCSIKKAVLKNFAIFTGKHLCRSFVGRLQHRFCEFFKHSYFQEYLPKLT